MDRAGLIRLLRSSGWATERGGSVFLCDPGWSQAERAQVAVLLDTPSAAGAGRDRGWLAVRTGGTGGQVKFARHDEVTLGAAVRGFCAHFGLPRVNAVGVLPLHHVSGLMASLRCAMTGGEYVAWDWKRMETGDVPVLSGGSAEEWVLSLVPTQLQRLLARKETQEWLRRFRVILVGGGPLWVDLADTAAAARLPIAISYGMTETAAMVTALRPEEFLGGARSCGAPLPHAQVGIAADGVVTIAGESVFQGYWPEWRAAREFVTEDLGRIDERGHLHVLGRRDALIISGGKKISPVEVEAALRASGEFDDVVVIGVPDAEWGEKVIACFPASTTRTPDVTRATAGLAAHQRPKHFVPVADWPRNAQGKINRAELRARILEATGWRNDSGRT